MLRRLARAGNHESGGAARSGETERGSDIADFILFAAWDSLDAE